jgi:hypothetical protein
VIPKLHQGHDSGKVMWRQAGASLHFGNNICSFVRQKFFTVDMVLSGLSCPLTSLFAILIKEKVYILETL